MAVALRARAATWEQVGHLLRRRPAVCRRWLDRYPEVWNRLYYAAEDQLLDEAVAEACIVLGAAERRRNLPK